eukprot:g82940.t1
MKCWCLVQVKVVNQTLREINLGLNNTGDAGAQAIGEALKVNKTLTSLSLTCSGIGDTGTKAIGEALRVNKTLREINLRWNNIGDAGAQAIGEALKENKECKLEKLDISRNQIGAEGAQHIAKALEVNKTFKTLDIAWNSIGAQGAENIAQAMKSSVNKSITTLNLNLNNIGPDGAAAIGKALEVNEALQVLSLIDNNIGPEGATRRQPCQGFDWIVQGNKTLIKIDLGLIGIDGAKAIGAALEVNEILQTLSIASTPLEAQGAMCIAEALKINPTLKDLNGMELKEYIKDLPKELEDKGNREILKHLLSIEEAKPPKFCRAHHALRSFATSADSARYCDSCFVPSLRKRVRMYGCRECTFGLCEACYARPAEVGLPLALRLRQQLEEEPNPFRCAEFKKQMDQIRPQVEQEHAKVESIKNRAVDELTEMASMQTLRVKELNAKQEKAKMTLSQCKQALPKAKKAYEKAVQALTKAKKTFEKATKDESEATHAVAEGKQALTQAEEAREIAKEAEADVKRMFAAYSEELQREKARLGAEVEELLVPREKSWKAQFHSWSEQDVQQWLQALAGGQFAHLAPKFKLNGIDGQQLAGLQDDVQLRRCGVNKNKDRLELWPHVEALVQPPRKKRRIAKCTICEENPASIILAPCGHKSLCLECVMRLRQNQKPCPICQTAIDGIVQKELWANAKTFYMITRANSQKNLMVASH